MNLRQAIFPAVVLIGFIVPFVPILVVIEFFYLLIPMAAVCLAATLYLFASFFTQDINKAQAVKTALIIPTFIGAQLLSGFLVDTIQKSRCEYHIGKLDGDFARDISYPDNYDVGWGLKYEKSNGEKKYALSYSRGFFVTERYSSDRGRWVSYGWND